MRGPRQGKSPRHELGAMFARRAKRTQRLTHYLGGIVMRAYAKTAAAAGICVAGVLGAGDANAQVKLGAVLSVTGPASFLGDPEKDARNLCRRDQRRRRRARPEAAARRLRRRRRRRKGPDLRQAPDRAGQGRRHRRRLHHRHHHGHVPLAEQAQSRSSRWPAPSRSSSRSRSGCSRRRTPTAWRARRSSPTCKRASSPRRADLRQRRLRQVDAGRMREGRAQVRDRDRRRRNLWRHATPT